MKLDPSKIIVNERQRKEEHNVEGLAVSINNNGQFHPIAVNSQHELVFGYGRLMACLLLGIKVEARIVESDDLLTLKEMELEENTRRKELHWSDRIRAEFEIFNLRKVIHGESYTQKHLADDMDLAQPTISQDLKLAELVKRIPDLAKLPSKEAALRTIKELEQKELTRILKERADENVKRVLEVAEETAKEEKISMSDALAKSNRLYITRGLAEEEIPKIASGVYDIVVTDPPYGIELMAQKKRDDENMVEFDEEEYGEDTKETYITLMENVIPELYRVMAEESHLWMFMASDPSMQKFVMELAREVGFNLDPIPYIWFKIGETGQTKHPENRAGRIYESFFFAQKGMMPLAQQGRPNVLAYKTLKPEFKIHPTEKPVGLMHDIIARSASPGMSIFDPFCGAGSSMVAAKILGLIYRGIDKSAYYVESTVQKLSTVT